MGQGIRKRAKSEEGAEISRKGRGATILQQEEKMDIDTFQREIDKWEEFYDDMKARLTDGSLPAKSQNSFLKQAALFFLGADGNLYYKKSCKNGALQLTLRVVRSYEERLRICKDIHLNTGYENVHHRRDTMMDLVGQQYYWKGQRRDICECVSDVL